MRTVQHSQRFIVMSAALFFGSAALTIAWCRSMSSLHDMPMCSTRSPTSTIHSAAAFALMWMPMMIAMMLPSLMPMLLRYRHAASATTTARVGLGYFSVWAVFGIFAYVADAMLSAFEMRWPPATGLIVLIAGALQFTRWKARHLARCRETSACCDAQSVETQSAWRHGVRLGVHCVHCCFGLTVMLLAVGIMDLRAMALLTAAISAERLAPDGLRIARYVGAVLIALGTFWMV